MNVIENIRIDLSRKEDDLTGQAIISTSDKEVMLLDLNRDTVWIIVALLQNLVVSEIKR